MFACLQITKEARPLWPLGPQPRLLARRRAAPPALVRVTPPGGAAFFRLEAAQRGKGELPWAEIERAAGRLRTRMLFPEGLCPPPPAPPRSAAQAQLEPGLRAFLPRRLPLLLCLRTAQQILQKTEAPARQLRVTVVDPRSVLARQLEHLVPLAGSLRVFTPEPAIYRAAAAQLQRRYGVTLVVSDSPACFAQSHLVIADDLRLFTGRESGLILTPDTETPLPGGAACRVARGRGPLLPEAHAPLCPPGIDPLLFACALYELCGVKEMERLRFSHFEIGGAGENYSIEQLAGMVDNICMSTQPHLRQS